MVAEGTTRATRPPVQSEHAELPAKYIASSRLGRFATMLDQDAIEAAQKFRCKCEHNCMDRFGIDAIASIRSNYMWLGGEHEQARWRICRSI